VTRPILVTGIHRSGTGWVGRMLAASPSPRVAYLWEPFSPRHRPGVCDVSFPRWFTYVCEENAGHYAAGIRDMLSFRYKTAAEAKVVRSVADVARLGRDWSRFVQFRKERAVPLMKDPIAVFSSEWLAEAFDMNVVMLIRHPAAFTASLKRLNWTHPFEDFLRQPLLMRDHLGPWKQEIELQARRPGDVIDQAILLWMLVHTAIMKFLRGHDEWVSVRLEDIAVDPVGQFRPLFGALGLTFDEDVRATILAHSNGSGPAVSTSLSSVKRDSARSIRMWKTVLSAQEIDRVRTSLDPLWREFYADDDW
jgi:hypothetical protein